MSNPQKKKLIIQASSNESENEGKSETDKSETEETEERTSSNSESSIKGPLDYDLKSQFEKLGKDACQDENYYSSECNKFLLKKEVIEGDYLSKNPYLDVDLYPNLSDTNFNIKIANKEEFSETKYEGPDFSKSLKEQADILANADFELQPHQAFIKNFMSFQTPYNSLLLYHGLGSGKTCSAIGVCEEMRDYMKQMGISKRIMIVASENVQDNFKLQLFDERKLKLVDGIWNIRGCTGNKLLQEINPMNMKGMPRDKVISQIKNIINSYYIFLGYGQFANYIIKTMNFTDEDLKTRVKHKKGEKPSKKQGEKTKIQSLKDIKITLDKKIINRLRNEFDNRLIVIDEVHNIRKADDNENKKVAINLELLVKAAKNMRFLLLSATPMYNSYKEIVWLLNLMNMNDRRGKIEAKNVFDKNGNIKNEELLIRKATGYVSFVRGENPYTFPYRVYPTDFAKAHTFKKFTNDKKDGKKDGKKDDKIGFNYPSVQMNNMKILNNDKNRILSLYLNQIGDCNDCGKCQYCVYKYIIYNLKNKSFSITTKKGVVRDMPNFENMESFGYTLLQTPLESLIISYPIEGLKEELDSMPKDKPPTVFDEEFAKASVLTNKKENDEPEDDKPGFVVETEVNVELDDAEEKTKVEKVRRRELSIDPHLLTGKSGLERMMNFVDEKSPPQKGDFEYKPSTLEKYERIFSREEIGKYSSKIKCVLDNIFNPEIGETGYVSQGIILIYSQYIDSGLIPMALALEEMGFTRYGENVKPLFKNKPTDVVDVRTMAPPANRKDFMPARYSMITGDPRLSPNNDFEVKGLTGDDNKDGHKVKVVLISRAGSEGIDFKFIRQVHILEPWYNMNRIEQIIGRAVRNFSHKDLDFEKRNVEIFMYGTILGEENKEEAADLYVYRVAEFKAIQIGHVTRVLKETAVDCIINADQQLFTQKNMSDNLKTPIKQILSNGVIIPKFKVGDAPFSPACDYMAKCNYDCRSDTDLDISKLENSDTYNENFIMNNSEKILQRIRMLMKESYFYIKKNLIDSIKTPKDYPMSQIFAALSKLIEDKNEFIVDKYGRNGRLINIGEYYLFQPIELRDENISTFDRSVPIDYKHEMINFEIKENIAKTGKKRDVEEIESEEKEEMETKQNVEGKKIISEFEHNLEITREYIKKPLGSRVDRGDDDWYKHCGLIITKISKLYTGLAVETLIEFMVAHMIELLLFEDKLKVMNYLYSLDNVIENSVEEYAKMYFEKNSIRTENFQAFILYNLNKRMIMINDNNKWVEAGPEDQREIAMSENAREELTIDKSRFNKLVGFIGYEKSNKYLTFKTKDMDSNRDTGARCDESGKDKALKKLSSILDENTFNTLVMTPKLRKEEVVVNDEDDKPLKDENGKVVKKIVLAIVLDKDEKPVNEIIGHVELCVLLEMMLRYLNDNEIKKNTKSKNKTIKYFLLPEMAIYYKLYKVL